MSRLVYNTHKEGLQDPYLPGPNLVFGGPFFLPPQSCQRPPSHSRSFSVYTRPPRKAGSSLVPPTLFSPTEFVKLMSLSFT